MRQRPEPPERPLSTFSRAGALEAFLGTGALGEVTETAGEAEADASDARADSGALDTAERPDGLASESAITRLVLTRASKRQEKPERVSESAP